METNGWWKLFHPLESNRSSGGIIAFQWVEYLLSSRGMYSVFAAEKEHLSTLIGALLL